MTIPSKVDTYLASAIGDVLRSDRQSAERALLDLGVDSSSALGRFYLKYQGGFITPRPVAELLDIEGPAIPSIPDQTAYIRERYNIPEQFLALTTDESEGLYLYGKDDEAVYDLDIGVLQEFLRGDLPPRWATFNEFLAWYFDTASQ